MLLFVTFRKKNILFYHLSSNTRSSTKNWWDHSPLHSFTHSLTYSLSSSSSSAAIVLQGKETVFQKSSHRKRALKCADLNRIKRRLTEMPCGHFWKRMKEKRFIETKGTKKKRKRKKVGENEEERGKKESLRLFSTRLSVLILFAHSIHTHKQFPIVTCA